MILLVACSCSSDNQNENTIDSSPDNITSNTSTSNISGEFVSEILNIETYSFYGNAL